MVYILRVISAICWLLIFFTAFAVIISPFSYFSGESELSELIIMMFIQGPISIAFFYWLGPNQLKKYKLKKLEGIVNQKGIQAEPQLSGSKKFNESATLNDQKEKLINNQKQLLERSYENYEHKLICEAINSGKTVLDQNLKGYLETNNYDDDSIKTLVDYGKTFLELKHSPSVVPNDEIWESMFIRNEVCIDMPKEYVEFILDKSDDTKRIENKQGTTLVCRYGKYKNKVGSYSYKYEVKYRNNKVISYKEI